MKCEEFTRLMTDKLAGEISQEQDKLLREHLASCPDCRLEFDRLEAFWNMTAETLKPSGGRLSDPAKENIFRHLEPTGNRRPALIPLVWLRLAAGFIIISFFIIVLLPKLNRTVEKKQIRVRGQAVPAYEAAKGTPRKTNAFDSRESGEDKLIKVVPSSSKSVIEKAMDDKVDGRAENAPSAPQPAFALREETQKDSVVKSGEKREKASTVLDSVCLEKADKDIAAIKAKKRLDYNAKPGGARAFAAVRGIPVSRTLFFYKEKFSGEEIKQLLAKDGITVRSLELIPPDQVKLELSPGDNLKLKKLLEGKTFFLRAKSN